MTSLRRKDLMKRAAARAVEAARQAGQLARTVQISRSTVESGEDTVPVAGLLADAPSVADAVGDHGLALEAVDPAIETTDDVWDADDSAHVARMESLEASEKVSEALAGVEQAVEDAANAQTTADGKNARRRGQTEPSPPDGGWQHGDQWVVDNADGQAIEVRVWNGTAFVHETTLTGELLVVGVDGNVRLANGVVTADAVAAEFYFGREFHGGAFIGGRFELADAEDPVTLWADDCESLSDWGIAPGGGSLSLSSFTNQGSWSVTFPHLSAYTISCTDIDTAVEYGQALHAWMYNDSAFRADLWVTLSSVDTQLASSTVRLEPQEWVQVSIPITGTGEAETLAIRPVFPTTGSPIHVSSVWIASLIEGDSGLRIFRNSAGVAKLTSYSEDGRVVEVTSGGVAMYLSDSPSLATTFGPAAITQYGGGMPLSIGHASAGANSSLEFSTAAHDWMSEIRFMTGVVAFRSGLKNFYIVDDVSYLQYLIASNGSRAIVIGDPREFVYKAGVWAYWDVRRWSLTTTRTFAINEFFGQNLSFSPAFLEAPVVNMAAASTDSLIAYARTVTTSGYRHCQRNISGGAMGSFGYVTDCTAQGWVAV